MFVKWETHVCSLSLVLDSEKKNHYNENSFRTQNKPQNTIWNFPDIYIKRDASCSNNYFIVRTYSLIFHHEYSVLKFTLHELSPENLQMANSLNKINKSMDLQWLVKSDKNKYLMTQWKLKKRYMYIVISWKLLLIVKSIFWTWT